MTSYVASVHSHHGTFILYISRFNDSSVLLSRCSSPFYMHLKPQSDPKLVLDVRGADRKSGAKVILYTDKGDLADNQLWYEDERGVVRSKMNGFAMDASGGLI